VIAVVTGASSGIGEAVARTFVRAGHTVIGVARHAEHLESPTPARDGAFIARSCDVTDTTAFRELLERTITEHGRVDVLVNNAGTAKALSIEETTPEEFRSILEVNAVAPAVAIHTLWSAMCHQGGGRIINVSSLAQLDPFPGFFAYAASKSALHLLTVVANAEGAPHGVRAFTVAPGVVDTPLHRALMPDGIPPVDGLASALHPDEVARIILEIAEGERDHRAGWVLAMPAPAAVTSLRRWVIEHPGGGVEIIS
jgi:NAD(P)-dependent dehydrogenase (short-subunit alcohol dehydrogenase family)